MITHKSTKSKVFGIGLGRTGTKSLTSSLNELGYSTKHFPLDVLNDCYDYDALTDSPVCVYYKELEFLFPDAKFILTVRDKDSWLESWQRLNDFQHKRFNNDLHIYIQMIRKKLFSQVEFDPIIWSKAYDKYIEEVNEYFTKKNKEVLTLDIINGEGYEKLCSFLGCDSPKKEFPNIQVNNF